MADNAPTGQLIGGRYRLEHRIASGGMASVWEAVDEVLARRVAVKVLHPHLAADAQFVARFRREAVAAAGLAHPSIVSIFDTCSDGAGPGAEGGSTNEAIVMELVRGTTLRAELDRRGRFEPADAIAVIAEVADALQAAHDAGIVHRDVKPANVLLSADGRVLVADFGIAKAADGLDLTNEGMTLGTAKYLAPEQVEGRPVDGRADVYAAGVILYELLCGRAPFQAETEAGTALARLHRPPDPPRSLRPELSPDLEGVVLRALARDPEQRTPSARALRDELRAVGRGDAPAASRPLLAPLPPVPVPPVPVPPVTGPVPTAPGLGDPTMATFDATRAAPATGYAPPAPVPPAPSPPRSPAQPSHRRRRWGLTLTGILVVAAAAIAIVLALQAGGDDDPGRPFGRNPGTGATELSVTSFDPEGNDGDENSDQAPLAVDGDATTAWRSSCYASASFGGLKGGVGLIVDLGQSIDVADLVVDAAPTGWTAGVYVADEAGTTVEDWGTAAGTVDGATSASTRIDLDDARGRFVLLFFTGLGTQPSPACSDFPFGISVAELTVGQG